jgi:hypothetical protein
MMTGATAVMTLQELLETMIHEGIMPPSRIPPMRTAVKQYAAMLGMDPAQCPPAVYHLPPAQFRSFIEANAPATVGPHALRNLKNNLRFLLRTGVARHWIAPLADPLHSWREARALSDGWRTPYHEGITLTPYVLRPLPPKLAAEFQAFAQWCSSPYVHDRPASIKKRASSLGLYERQISSMAGFLVHLQQKEPDTLTFLDLTNPTLVDHYTSWWVTRRGKVTITIHHALRSLKVIAQYWLKDEARTEGITRIKQALGQPESVRDKHKRWLTLEQLEAIGCSRYPFNAKRLLEYEYARRLYRGRRASGSMRRIAIWVELSLIIRLLVRIPLRQRNIRELQLGQNLIPPSTPTGTWQIRFRGAELKVGYRHGRENILVHNIPSAIQGLLEEWLTRWRPLLLKEANDPYVFLTEKGNPFRPEGLYSAITRTTWKFSGVRMNPHLIRDIWATEYIKSTRDLIGAASRLGDTVESVLRHYAHLLDADAESRASDWLQGRLNGQATHGHDAGFAHNPLGLRSRRRQH